MSREPRKFTTAELDNLPTGTLLSRHDVDEYGFDSIQVFLIEAPHTVKLISHTGSFSFNLSSLADSVPLSVIGFDQYSQKHVYGKGKMRIYYNRSLTMSPGKLAAHAVHAALTALGVHHGLPVVVLQAGPQKIEAMRTHIYDAGHTELAPGTLTTGTEWPLDSEER